MFWLVRAEVVGYVFRHVVAATGGYRPYWGHARRQRGIQRAFMQRDDTLRVISNLHVAVSRLQRVRLAVPTSKPPITIPSKPRCSNVCRM